MDEVTRLQEIRAAELNRLVNIQHNQVEMLKALLKVKIKFNILKIMTKIQKQEGVDEAQTRLINTLKTEIEILKSVIEKKDREMTTSVDQFQQAFLKLAEFAAQPCCKECAQIAQKDSKRKKK